MMTDNEWLVLWAVLGATIVVALLLIRWFG